MISRCRLAISTLLVGLVAIPLNTAQAQAPRKQVAMLSISSVDALLGTINYLTEAGGAPQYGQVAAVMAQPYTEGWDTANPIGLVLTTDGQQDFAPLAFVPVKDLGKALSMLEDQFGAARDVRDGIKELPMFPPVFLKQQGGFAFVAQAAEALDNLPANPVAQLGKLPQDYDVAIRGFVQNVPRPYIDMAVNALQGGIQQGLANLPDEDREAQAKMLELQMKQMEVFIKESDQITIGWKTAPGEQRTYLDITFTAIPGSSLAKQMNMMANAKTDYAGFVLPGAAVSMLFSSEVPQEQMASAINALDGLKATATRELERDAELQSPEAREAAKKLLNSAVDLFTDTMKTGKMDGGASVVLDPGNLSVMAGFHVADGKEVEKLLRGLADMAKDEPDFPGINFNADRMGEVTFHTMNVEVPANEPQARKLLGPQLEMAIASGPTSAYLGVGKDCVARLKQIIQSQPKQKKILPFEVVVALKPIMQFVGSMDDNPMVGAMNDALESVGDKDHANLLGLPVENGFIYRIQLEEGIIKAIGEAVKMANAGGF